MLVNPVEQVWRKPCSRAPTLQRGSRVGDGRESRARPCRADGWRTPGEEIIRERVRLERAAGFARHDEQRARGIEAVRERRDLIGLGCIRALVRNPGQRSRTTRRQHFGPEAGAAHAEEQHGG